MSKCKTRAELDDMLLILEAEIPKLIARQGTAGDFDFSEFAGHADLIEDSAGPEDCEYVKGRIQCILGSAGLIPSESEGEPCTGPGASDDP